MKAKFHLFTISLILLWSAASFAGVLMSQWGDGTKRYCKYSDGEVIEIFFGSTCPSSN